MAPSAAVQPPIGARWSCRRRAGARPGRRGGVDGRPAHRERRSGDGRDQRVLEEPLEVGVERSKLGPQPGVEQGPRGDGACYPAHLLKPQPGDSVADALGLAHSLVQHGVGHPDDVRRQGRILRHQGQDLQRERGHRFGAGPVRLVVGEDLFGERRVLRRLPGIERRRLSALQLAMRENSSKSGEGLDALRIAVSRTGGGRARNARGFSSRIDAWKAFRLRIGTRARFVAPQACRPPLIKMDSALALCRTASSRRHC
jgi:hypothetical protein